MDEFIRREHKERFTSDNFDWGEAENNEAKCSSKIIKLESERREFITTLPRRFLVFFRFWILDPLSLIIESIHGGVKKLFTSTRRGL
jgi:hypothetical protein